MSRDIVKLRYKDWGLYNNPEVNERKAELPLAFWFLESFGSRVMEIGEVTPFYEAPAHRVYDTVPEKPETYKIDAADIDYRGRDVLAISTVEHVGSGDYGQQPVAHAAIALVSKIVTDAKNYLITFAVGSNYELEQDMIDKNVNFFLIERSLDNLWQQVDHRDLGKYKYGSPLPHGNAIVVITNLQKEFVFERID